MKYFYNYLSGSALPTSTAIIPEVTDTRVDSFSDGIINDQSQPIATKATEGNNFAYFILLVIICLATVLSQEKKTHFCWF